MRVILGEQRSVFLVFCPNCGVEIVVEPGSKLDNCPICDAKRGRLGDGYFFCIGREFIDKTFQRMKDTRAERGLIDPDPLFSMINPCYDNTTTVFSPSRIDEIRTNPEKMKEYITKLFDLEANVLSLKNMLLALYAQRYKIKMELNTLNERFRIEMEKKLQADLEKFSHAENTYKAYKDQLEKYRDCEITIDDIPEPPRPTLPQYQTPNFFNKKKVLAQNEALESQYKQDMLEYERKCQQRLVDIEQQKKAAQKQHLIALQRMEKKVQDAKKKMDSLKVNPDNYIPQTPTTVCPEKAKQQIIDSEIEKAETLLKKLYQTRHEIYAANIIFHKYRDIVALGTFYEYLLSGRCTTLDGPNGAYNLYESEIRANQIISKLTEIEKSLSKIEQNQYMIYSKLIDMNSTLSQMNRTMDSAYSAITEIQAKTNDMNKYMNQISKNTKVIAHNTATTAYYSKLNAELTDALGYLVALK